MFEPDCRYMIVYRVKVDEKTSYYFSNSFKACDFSDNISYIKIDSQRIKKDGDIFNYVDKNIPRIK
jgi:hypothetical protein